MSARHKQLSKRLDAVEAALRRRAQSREIPLYRRVEREAEQELDPEDLRLFRSGEAAWAEGRFHTLEEHEVQQKFDQLRDVVARRYGFHSYGNVFREYLEKHGGKSTKPSNKGIAILRWARLNCAHLHKLRQALEASESDPVLSASTESPSTVATSTSSQDPKL